MAWCGGIRQFFTRNMQLKGSVFVKSFCVAFPSAIVAFFIKLLMDLHYIELGQDFMLEGKAFTTFSGLVGFLIVFRTSQAYTRFWDGCAATHQMRAEWCDTCSLLMAFARVSKNSPEKLYNFQGTLIRLFSMLHAAALAELEEINVDAKSLDDILGFRYKLIDPEGIDESALRQIKNCPSKVELLYIWIQMLITENIDSGVIQVAPPILSRAFQTLSNGMLAFFDALKITYCPFPFPYTQTCDFLLIIHWCVAPMVTSQWVSNPYLAAVFVFIQVFILWALNHIACEIQNPFGKDANDLDGWSMQEEMNRHLLLLLSNETKTLPGLSASALQLEGLFATEGGEDACALSFLDVWNRLADDGEPVPEPARKGQVFTPSSAVQLKVSAQTSRSSFVIVRTPTGHPRRSSRLAKTSSTGSRPPPIDELGQATEARAGRPSNASLAPKPPAQGKAAREGGAEGARGSPRGSFRGSPRGSQGGGGAAAAQDRGANGSLGLGSGAAPDRGADASGHHGASADPERSEELSAAAKEARGRQVRSSV